MKLTKLMHLEFQINNELVGKRVLKNFKISNEIADEQHGSINHHQARILAFNKC